MKRSEGKGSFTILTWPYYVRCAVHGRPCGLLAMLGCDFDRDPFGGIDLWKIVKFENGVVVERITYEVSPFKESVA